MGSLINPRFRYVGNYAINLLASSTGSFTISSGDLQYSGDSRTLYVMAAYENSVTLNSLTISGAGLSIIEADAGNFRTLVAHIPTAGALTVDAVFAGAVIAGTSFDVYESADCWPIVGFDAYSASAASSPAITARLPVGGFIGCQSYSPTDTATFTWTNATEINDADQGDYRTSAAADLTPSLTNKNLTVTAAGTSGTNRIQAVVVTPKTALHVIPAITSSASVSASTTSTHAIAVSYGMGSDTARIYFCIALEVNTTISGCTWGGVACTLAASIINTAATPDIVMSVFYIDTANRNDSLVITYGASTTATFVIDTVLVFGAHTIGTVFTQASTGSGPSTAVAVAEGGSVLGYLAHSADTATVTCTNIAEYADTDIGTFRFAAGFIRWGNVNAALTISMASAGSAGYTAVYLPLNPA